jgi:hypothetical protein
VTLGNVFAEPASAAPLDDTTSTRVSSARARGGAKSEPPVGADTAAATRGAASTPRREGPVGVDTSSESTADAFGTPRVVDALRCRGRRRVGATPAVAGAVDTGATARIVRGVGRDASTGAGTSEVAW